MTYDIALAHFDQEQRTQYDADQLCGDDVEQKDRTEHFLDLLLLVVRYVPFRQLHFLVLALLVLPPAFTVRVRVVVRTLVQRRGVVGDHVVITVVIHMLRFAGVVKRRNVEIAQELRGELRSDLFLLRKLQSVPQRRARHQTVLALLEVRMLFLGFALLARELVLAELLRLAFVDVVELKELPRNLREGFDADLLRFCL